MKKLTLLATMMLSLLATNSNAQPPTPDMVATSAEYENTTAQWYVKEAIALFLEQVVYDGWEQTTTPEGNVSVNVRFKNTFTDRVITNPFGNSQMPLRKGLVKLIDTNITVLSEEQAREFFNKARSTQIYANLRLRYDNNPRTFEEEFRFMQQVNLIPFADIPTFLRETSKLVNWRNDFIDDYNGL